MNKRSKRDELRAGMTKRNLVKIDKGDDWFELDYAEVPNYMLAGDEAEVYRGIYKGQKRYMYVEVL